MTREKTPKAPKRPKTTKKSKSVRRRRSKVLSVPDVSVLATYSPTDSANSHPNWVKTQFPAYVSPHVGHETTAVREFTHGGHKVKITTTYRVEVDGHLLRAHLSVDEDGRVYTHATPFVSYGSAVDLMKAVMDAYPDSFSDLGGGHGGHDGHKHGG